MKKRYLFILAPFLLFTLSCKKEVEEVLGTQATYNLPTFSGYTPTDANGVIMGTADATDWTNDATWTADEENLFPELANLTTGFPAYTSIQFHPSFPNPTSGASNFAVTKDSDMKISFRLVDSQGTILTQSSSQFAVPFAINTGGLSTSDTLIRLYYIIERNDSLLYRGHGDIRKN